MIDRSGGGELNKGSPPIDIHSGSWKPIRWQAASGQVIQGPHDQWQQWNSAEPCEGLTRELGQEQISCTRG